MPKVRWPDSRESHNVHALLDETVRSHGVAECECEGAFDAALRREDRGRSLSVARVRPGAHERAFVPFFERDARTLVVVHVPATMFEAVNGLTHFALL